MTDGSFNTSYFDDVLNNSDKDDPEDRIDDARSETTASRNASLRFCDLAKEQARNIEVYTIAFRARSSAEDLLRDCATPEDPNDEENTQHFFDADSNEQLTAAFESIIAQELIVLLIN